MHAGDNHGTLMCTEIHTHTHTHTDTHTHTPSLSTTVMTDVLGEPIATTSGLPTEEIITIKYSNSSVELSCIVDTIKVADI